MSFQEFSRDLNRFLRVAGRHEPAAQIFAQRLAKAELPVVNRANGLLSTEDYLLIDPSLAVTEPAADETVAAPDPRLGYAGYTAVQRFELLVWIDKATRPAPPAFQQFYLAHLETRLFEPAYADDALAALHHLQSVAAWHNNESLNRVILLAYWLKQDGHGLLKWLAQGHVDARTLGVALGMAALLQQPLTLDVLLPLWASWRPQEEAPSAQILAQHLLSLKTTLGQEPLAHALAQLPAQECQPKPWRALHRDLRIALPQPDLRPGLEPSLAEMAAAGGESVLLPAATAAGADADAINDDAAKDHKAIAANTKSRRKKPVKTKNDSAPTDDQWLLVLEFGHSRSEYFDYVLHRARDLPHFTQIMDEDRQIVYRVRFRKRDIRTFWRLWDYVNNWSNTHVYLHGKELEKWKIWPYSPHMK